MQQRWCREGENHASLQRMQVPVTPISRSPVRNVKIRVKKVSMELPFFSELSLLSHDQNKHKGVGPPAC